MLDEKYQRAADMKIADPMLAWAEIARKIEVSERQLRRVRESNDWQEYWTAADKEASIETIRRQAQVGANAQLWKLYFQVTGQMDPQALEGMLGFKDVDAIAAAKEISDWYATRSSDEAPDRQDGSGDSGDGLPVLHPVAQDEGRSDGENTAVAAV